MSPKGLVYNVSSMGLRTLPCGTPKVRVTGQMLLHPGIGSQLQHIVFCLTGMNLSMLELFHQCQNVYVGDPVRWSDQQCQKLLTDVAKVGRQCPFHP